MLLLIEIIIDYCTAKCNLLFVDHDRRVYLRADVKGLSLQYVTKARRQVSSKYTVKQS